MESVNWDEQKLETLREAERLYGPQSINCDTCCVRFMSDTMSIIDSEKYGVELWICPRCFELECMGEQDG